MREEKAIVGFIGAGGIARSHAYALNSLRYYYDDPPQPELEAVSSFSAASRESFAGKYSFHRSPAIEEFFSDKRINTVFILGPNKVHFEHLKSALGMENVRKIYLEKPVCSSLEEENEIAKLTELHPSKKIQVGFQFLFSSAVLEALELWNSGQLGKAIHFDLKYYHGDYLKNDYRQHRSSRLTPAPDGGAMADLGSHSISLLIAFLGDRLAITGAMQSGHFEDVPPESDLFSMISLYDESTDAVGTISASRISPGTGDLFYVELFAEKGAIRYSTQAPDSFEYYLEETGVWNRRSTGSNYLPVTSFPSGHVPPGWLRSMIHAHYVFLTDGDPGCMVPGIGHGLSVQRLVRQTADYLKMFRDKYSTY